MKSARPWVAYVGPVDFPEGGAAARRILGNAKALVLAGYDVAVVSGVSSACEELELEVAPGIWSVRLNERDAEHLPTSVRYARYLFMGGQSRNWLDRQRERPDAVILYSGYSPYLLRLTGWARRAQVPLLFDAVEWYTAENVREFLLSPYLWNIELAMRLLIPRLDGVVAISSALERYYWCKGMVVDRIPPLFDPDEMLPVRSSLNREEPIRLIYSGFPGRKDLLDIVIEAVIQKADESRQIVLEIVGLSHADLSDRPPLRRRGGRIPSCLRVYGRVSHKRSMELVGLADFSVFLRCPNRVSTNGFPTKFVESMAVGTPVLANITSDLGEHLRDGDTGIVCAAPNLDDMKWAIDRVLRLDTEARLAMRKAARIEAVKSFSFEIHAPTLGRLIQEARKRVSSMNTRI